MATVEGNRGDGQVEAGGADQLLLQRVLQPVEDRQTASLSLATQGGQLSLQPSNTIHLGSKYELWGAVLWSRFILARLRLRLRLQLQLQLQL